MISKPSVSKRILIFWAVLVYYLQGENKVVFTCTIMITDRTEWVEVLPLLPVILIILSTAVQITIVECTVKSDKCLYRHPNIPDSRLIPRVSSQSFLEFVMCLSLTDVCGRGMRDKALRTSAWEAVKWGGTYYWNKLLSFTHSRNNRITDNFLGPDGTDNKKHLSTLTLSRKISSSKCHFPVGYSRIYNNLFCCTAF